MFNPLSSWGVEFLEKFFLPKNRLEDKTKGNFFQYFNGEDVLFVCEKNMEVPSFATSKRRPHVDFGLPGFTYEAWDREYLKDGDPAECF